ncbi:ATP-binding protein [Ekhidna sp.]|uniref:ATP-binding protein n=1 Tax=Ekhidna sp. TaxID=2608089 RepID=UPI003C7999BE
MHRLLSLVLFFCYLPLSIHAFQDDSEKLEVIWYTSFPFIYEDEQGNVVGVEAEMLSLFQDYMKNINGVYVDLQFEKAKDFSDILDNVKRKDKKYIVGSSALSITEKRKQFAEFTESYLPDVTVLVSSAGTPIVNTSREKVSMLQNLNAVTIKGTKYEALLKDLREETGVNFETIYLSSDQNILEGVISANDRFGFIDLPIYLMLVQEGGEVTRQNFFTTQGDGYAFILPTNSIWKNHLNEFLSDPNSQAAISGIISKYLGEELYFFIDNLYRGELGTSILTKEKEMQLELLRNVNLRLEQEQAVRRILIVSTGIAILLLVAIAYLYYRNQKTTNLLLGQKSQIEVQQQDIQQKNEQLMNRNAQLVALNEEKNNLVRILAHDIRSPLSQIIMVADILNHKIDENLPETDVKLLNQVTASAERINKMVTKILDVDGLEENRVKVMNERVDIRDVMRDVAQRYRPIAAKKNIDLSVEFCDDHYMIRTDHLLLLLVLENLISNAVKFSEQDTSVGLRAQCEYDSVLFKVSDEGPGFSESDKKKLFNRFQKLSAKPTAGESSTGLGLSIVKKYVQDLGGKVWVESELGKGSTFFVKLSA